LYMC